MKPRCTWDGHKTTSTSSSMRSVHWLVKCSNCDLLPCNFQLAATNGLRCPIGSSPCESGADNIRGCSADKCYFQIFESFEQDTTKATKKPPGLFIKTPIRPVLAMRSAISRTCCSCSPSTMTRIRGSVPDLRTAPGHGRPATPTAATSLLNGTGGQRILPSAKRVTNAVCGNLLMPERNLANGISALRMAVSTCGAATIPSPWWSDPGR